MAFETTFLVSKDGIWKKENTVSTDYIKSLIASLPTVIEATLATKTKNKYESAWKAWQLFSTDKTEITFLPAYPFFTVVYFNHLLVTNSLRGITISTFYGIRWGHLFGMANGTDLLQPADAG